MRAGALGLLLALAGCGSDPCEGVEGTCIALTVEGEGEVDGIGVTLSGAASGMRVGPALATPSALPVLVAVRIATLAAGGSIHLDVEGARLGRTVGRGAVDVAVAPGEHVAAAVRLVAGAGPPDAGSADAARACDPNRLASDPRHCGACGHDCLGGACVASVCQPALLAAVEAPVTGLASDGTDLFALSGSGRTRIVRVPLSGGAPTTLAANEDGPGGLAQAKNALYWAVPDSGLVRRLPTAGGATATFASTQPGVTWVAAAGDDLWAWNVPARTLERSSLTAPGFSPVPVPSVLARGLAADGVRVFWTESSGAVSAMSTAGGPVSRVASGQAVPLGIAVDGTTLVWANGGDGTIVASPTTSFRPEPIASGQQTPGAVAIDPTSIYWANGDGRVYRLAR